MIKLIIKKYYELKFAIRRWAVTAILNITNRDITDPYVVQIENTSDKEANAVLFGYNRFFNAVNHGSDSCVKVSNLQSGPNPLGYTHLLFETVMRSKIGFIRYQSSSSHAKEDNPITVVHHEANGRMYTSPIILNNHWSELNIQDSLIDIVREIIVDGNTYFELKLKPKQKIVISTFPSTKTKPMWLNESL